MSWPGAQPHPDPSRGGPVGPRGRVIVLALLAVLVVVVLLAVLRDCGGSGATSAPPATTSTTPGPAGPTPTFPISLGGYRYRVGVSPLVPMVVTGTQETRTAPPGRHFLVAQLVIRNDTDRPAPALLDSLGAAPAVKVGLSGVRFLPPVHAVAYAVSDCDNDPRQLDMAPASEFKAPPPQYRGADADTCLVAATAVPAQLTPSGVDDTVMPPGATTSGVITTIDLPDDVPVTATDVWTTTATGQTPAGFYGIWNPIQ